MTIAYFQASTRIFFGPGVMAEVASIAQQRGLTKVLLVTDAGLMRTGIPNRVSETLARAGVDSSVFDAVEANPSIATVDRALDAYRAQGCQGLIAVGGGSPMDAAKAVGLLATHPGKLLDYVGIGKVVHPLPTLIAIPTTTGTGSEVTQFTVITDHAQRRTAYMLAVGDPDPLLQAIVTHLPPEGFNRLLPSEVVRRLSDLLRAAGDAPLPHIGGGKAISNRLRKARGALRLLGFSLNWADDRVVSSQFSGT